MMYLKVIRYKERFGEKQILSVVDKGDDDAEYYKLERVKKNVV